MVRIDTGLMMAQQSQNIAAFGTNVYSKSSCARLSIPPFMYFIAYAQREGTFQI
jgi:hypothetical protein